MSVSAGGPSARGARRAPRSTQPPNSTPRHSAAGASSVRPGLSWTTSGADIPLPLGGSRPIPLAATGVGSPPMLTPVLIITALWCFSPPPVAAHRRRTPVDFAVRRQDPDGLGAAGRRRPNTRSRTAPSWARRCPTRRTRSSAPSAATATSCSSWSSRSTPSSTRACRSGARAGPTTRTAACTATRSRSIPTSKRGRLWTGGLYDEGRRGWLADLKDNEAARKAFKPDVWNKLRVRGDRRLDQDLDQRRAGRRPGRRQGPGGLHRAAGAPGGQAGGSAHRRLAEDPHPGARAAGLAAAAGTARRLRGPARRRAEATWTVEGNAARRARTSASEARHGLLFVEAPLGDFTARAEVRLTGGNGGHLPARASRPRRAGRGQRPAGRPRRRDGAAGSTRPGAAAGWRARGKNADEKAREKLRKSWKAGDWNAVTVVGPRRPGLAVHVNDLPAARHELPAAAVNAGLAGARAGRPGRTCASRCEGSRCCPRRSRRRCRVTPSAGASGPRARRPTRPRRRASSTSSWPCRTCSTCPRTSSTRRSSGSGRSASRRSPATTSSPTSSS